MAKERKIFAVELKSIQRRHSLFFTKEQTKQIKVVPEKDTYKLELKPDLVLSDVVIMEIKLALKLSYLGKKIIQTG